MKPLRIFLGAFIVTLPGVWILFLLNAVGGNWFEIDMEIMQTALGRTVVVTSAYFGLSGHLFRFHPARRFGVIRPA